MNKQAELIGVYDYNDNAVLIELIVDEIPEDIDFGNFCVPNNKLEKSFWQVAYMEQYLDEDGINKLCDTFDTPNEKVKPSRIAFFIFKDGNVKLSTPYGDFSILNFKKLPDRLAKIIDFDDFD
jgi:hypothetical protein